MITLASLLPFAFESCPKKRELNIGEMLVDTFFEELAGFLLIIISDVKFLVDIIELALELRLVALCIRNEGGDVVIGLFCCKT